MTTLPTSHPPIASLPALWKRFSDKYGSQNSVRAADSVEVIEIAETMDLNQVEIVSLQKFQALLYRTQRAISVPRIDLGREKDLRERLNRWWKKKQR